jgi:hypothetical protein
VPLALSPEPWLREYKRIYKIIVQESVPPSQFQHDLSRLEKQLERWLAKIRLQSSEYTLSTLYGEQHAESGDIFALAELANALAGSQCLTSKTLCKHLAYSEARIPPSLPVWSDLFRGIQERHHLFAGIFIRSMLENLTQGPHLSSVHKTVIAMWICWSISHLVERPVDVVGLTSTLFNQELSSEGDIAV